MKKMFLYIAFIFIASNLQAQKLNKTDILQEDVYLHPPHYDAVEEKGSTRNKNFNRLRLRLLDIRAMLTGDYNGDSY